MIALIMQLVLAASLSPRDIEYATDWAVILAENDSRRVLATPDPQDRRFPFAVNQGLAPGWSCEVKPEALRSQRRERWVVCEFRQGRARVMIRVSCRADHADRQSQEVWLGDKLAVELVCRSGVAP